MCTRQPHTAHKMVLPLTREWIEISSQSGANSVTSFSLLRGSGLKWQQAYERAEAMGMFSLLRGSGLKWSDPASSP